MRRLALLVVGSIAVGSACGTTDEASPTTTPSSATSEPSVDAIAQDVVEALPITSSQRRCMLGRLARYDQDTLERIGTENQSVDLSSPDAIESASPALRAFVDDLRACMTGDVDSVPAATGPSPADR